VPVNNSRQTGHSSMLLTHHKWRGVPGFVRRTRNLNPRHLTEEHHVRNNRHQKIQQNITLLHILLGWEIINDGASVPRCLAGTWTWISTRFTWAWSIPVSNTMTWVKSGHFFRWSVQYHVGDHRHQKVQEYITLLHVYLYIRLFLTQLRFARYMRDTRGMVRRV
jgi:hypothetical protein